MPFSNPLAEYCRTNDEQNVGPKPPTVRFEMEAVLAGARSTWSFPLSSGVSISVEISSANEERLQYGFDWHFNCLGELTQ